MCNPVADKRSGRFTQISSFGLNTIRCFPSDVADLSQRPAWFFEDVLQVRSLCDSSLNRPHSLAIYCSVPSPCSKVSSPLPMTRAFNASYSGSQNGMRWPSFECTRMILLCSSNGPYVLSAISSAFFNETRVKGFILVSYPRKRRSGRGGKWPSSMLADEGKKHVRPCFRKNSILTPTSSTRLETTSP